jgi:hypothetical protein
LAHASPFSCSYKNDDKTTVQADTSTKQAARVAAYIARVVSEAPPLSDAQLDHIAVLLRPVIRQNGTPTISVDDYRYWEIRRHLDSETPGRHGYFTAEDAA